MALKRMVMELGMGTDIQGQNHTKAAVRALENALRQNSLSVADAFGQPREAMHVHIIVGAAEPEQVDKKAVAAVLPYGTPTVKVERGGMDTPKDDGSPGTVMVNVAVIVYLDLPDDVVAGAAA